MEAALTSLMASSSINDEDFEALTTSAVTTATTTVGSQKENDGAGAPFEIACGYDNLLEENMILRNILEEVKRRLTATETSLDELKLKASAERSLTTESAGATPDTLTAKLNRVVLSKKKILDEKNTLKKHNAQQAQIGAQLTAKLEETEAKLVAARNELLQMMPLKLALQESKEKNEKLSLSLTTQISDLRIAQTSAASMRDRKNTAEKEAEDLRGALNKLSRKLAACEADRDRHKRARQELSERLGEAKRRETPGPRTDPHTRDPTPHVRGHEMVLPDSTATEEVQGLDLTRIYPPTTSTPTNSGATTGTSRGVGATVASVPRTHATNGTSQHPPPAAGLMKGPLKPWWTCPPQDDGASTYEDDDNQSISTFNSEDYEHYGVLSACSPSNQNGVDGVPAYSDVLYNLNSIGSTYSSGLAAHLGMFGRDGMLAPFFQACVSLPDEKPGVGTESLVTHPHYTSSLTGGDDDSNEFVGIAEQRGTRGVDAVYDPPAPGPVVLGGDHAVTFHRRSRNPHNDNDGTR